jgi:hypothetical protein
MTNFPIFPFSHLNNTQGKRNVRVKQVESSTASLNDGDVFILDMGLEIYQWNGASCNRMEKAKALTVCTRLRDDRGAKPVVRIIESSEKDEERTTGFWEALGGYAAPATAEEGGDDKAEEKKAKKELKLYNVSDESGEIKTNLVAEGKLKRDMLIEDDSFVLDTGSALYCWIGKGASKDEKKSAFTTANTFLVENKRPAWTPVSMVLDGGETPGKKIFMRGWLVAVGCSWLQLVGVGWSCLPLLFAVGWSCLPLLFGVGWSWLELFAVVCRCLPLFAVVCRCLPLFAVVCRCFPLN